MADRGPVAVTYEAGPAGFSLACTLTDLHYSVTVVGPSKLLHAVGDKAKTHEKDAFIIADAARTMSHTLRGLQLTDEEEAALGMLTGFDLDLALQVNQTSNRIRGLFTQIHPPLERFLGARLDYDAILEVPAAWPTLALLKYAGKARIDANSRNTEPAGTPPGSQSSWMR